MEKKDFRISKTADVELERAKIYKITKFANITNSNPDLF